MATRWGCLLLRRAVLYQPACGRGFQSSTSPTTPASPVPQVELPDYWLDKGNPWEIRRPDTRYKVGFYGSLVDGAWQPAEEVWAEAYDVPIPGYATKTTSNLRLWNALPVEEFNLDAFNAGDYEKVRGAGKALGPTRKQRQRQTGQRDVGPVNACTWWPTPCGTAHRVLLLLPWGVHTHPLFPSPHPPCRLWSRSARLTTSPLCCTPTTPPSMARSCASSSSSSSSRPPSRTPSHATWCVCVC